MAFITDKSHINEYKKRLFEELTNPNKICPFCKENEFDLVGLKNHLEKYCSAYLGVEDLYEEYKNFMYNLATKETE